MAKIVNIRRDVDDKFYRYKMPELLTKIEGKGNGIKTVLPNVSDVAKSLSRPPVYPTKFLGFELGAQTIIDDANDRYIVNGAHQSDRLRELLDQFIDKFVLCGSCKNPETDLVLTKVNKDYTIHRDCKACGQKTDINMRHKLASYITKNPPKSAGGKKSKGAHATANTNGGTGNPDEGDEDDDDEFSKTIKKDAADLPSTTTSKVADENDWSLDTSPEAVRSRAKLEGAMGALTMNDPAAGDDSGEEDPDSPYTILKNWAVENRDSVTAIDVYKKAQELGIEKKYKTLQVLGRHLFDENIVTQLKTFGPVIKKMSMNDEGLSEKHQKAFMGGVEQLVGIDLPDFDISAQVPRILMVLYEGDVLEEEFIQQWGTHVSKKYVDKDVSKKVRKAAEPFLKWLEEAEEDSD